MTSALSWPNSIHVLLALQLLLAVGKDLKTDTDRLSVPVIVDGRTQAVPEFKDGDLWIRHDLWVETEFDSDGDGKLDRMHVDVTRPRRTALDAAYRHHPNRFVRKPPQAALPPRAVWINPPKNGESQPVN